MLSDHLERQVPIALTGQNVPKSLEVDMAELAVAARGSLRLHEPLGLEESQLGDRHIGEVGAQERENISDAHQASGRDGGHDAPPRSESTSV